MSLFILGSGLAIFYSKFLFLIEGCLAYVCRDEIGLSALYDFLFYNWDCIFLRELPSYKTCIFEAWSLDYLRLVLLSIVSGWWSLTLLLAFNTFETFDSCLRVSFDRFVTRLYWDAWITDMVLPLLIVLHTKLSFFI